MSRIYKEFRIFELSSYRAPNDKKHATNLYGSRATAWGATLVLCCAPRSFYCAPNGYCYYVTLIVTTLTVVLDNELLAKFNAHCEVLKLNKSDMLRLMVKEFSEF